MLSPKMSGIHNEFNKSKMNPLNAKKRFYLVKKINSEIINDLSSLANTNSQAI